MYRKHLRRCYHPSHRPLHVSFDPTAMLHDTEMRRSWAVRSQGELTSVCVARTDHQGIPKSITQGGASSYPSFLIPSYRGVLIAVKDHRG
jgi:hypothetical protein